MKTNRKLKEKLKYFFKKKKLGHVVLNDELIQKGAKEKYLRFQKEKLENNKIINAYFYLYNDN